MPQELQKHLDQLRAELHQDSPLSEEDRASLFGLMQEIEAQLAREAASEPDSTLNDQISMAVERFNADHPTLAAALRSVMQSLSNIGI